MAVISQDEAVRQVRASAGQEPEQVSPSSQGSVAPPQQQGGSSRGLWSIAGDMVTAPGNAIGRSVPQAPYVPENGRYARSPVPGESNIRPSRVASPSPASSSPAPGVYTNSALTPAPVEYTPGAGVVPQDTRGGALQMFGGGRNSWPASPDYQTPSGYDSAQALNEVAKNADTRGDVNSMSPRTIQYDPAVAALYGRTPESTGSTAATPFSYVDQLKKMQAIDPDRYGNGTGNTPDADIMTMPLGQVAAYRARKRQENAMAALGAEHGYRGIEAEKDRVLRRGLQSEELGQRGVEAERDRAAKIGLLGTEYGYRGAEAEKERTAKQPMDEAHIAALGSQAGYHRALAGDVGAQAGLRQQQIAEMTDRYNRIQNIQHLIEQKTQALDAISKGTPAYDAAMRGLEGLKSQIDRERMAGNPAAVAKYAAEELKNPVIEQKANGGVVRGYADGGAIGRDQQDIQQVHPVVAQYGQYLREAMNAGVAPIPFAQFTSLSQSRDTLPNAHFADGGDVSALNRPLEGPGTGRSDSIPAVIDGTKPAALSKGEFVIPEHVVRAKGTEFFEKLIAQYSGEGK